MSLFLAAQSCQGPGKERWSIKTSIPSGASLTQSKTVPLADLLKVKAPTGVTRGDKRYEDALIPQTMTPPGIKEGDLITTTGYLYLVMLSNDDCDYHIQISPVSRTLTNKPQPGDDCLIVELPKPDYVSDPALKAQVAKLRAAMIKSILAGKEASNNGSVMQSSFQIRVTGQLFFDDWHVVGPPRGRKDMKSSTAWELHPVTNWEFVTKKGVH